MSRIETLYYFVKPNINIFFRQINAFSEEITLELISGNIFQTNKTSANFVVAGSQCGKSGYFTITIFAQKLGKIS